MPSSERCFSGMQTARSATTVAGWLAVEDPQLAIWSTLVKASRFASLSMASAEEGSHRVGAARRGDP